VTTRFISDVLSARTRSGKGAISGANAPMKDDRVCAAVPHLLLFGNMRQRPSGRAVISGKFFLPTRMNLEDRKQMIARILAPAQDVRANGTAFADRVLWSWERIAVQLAPLIGESGFHSLYLRAVHLAMPECPSITLLTHGKSTNDLFHQLRRDLILLDTVTTEFCSNALMNKFIELVSSMIGDALTAQILRTAWDEEPRYVNASKGEH
jgi:hypothetical protein